MIENNSDAARGWGAGRHQWVSEPSRSAIRMLAMIYTVERMAITHGGASGAEVSVLSLLPNELLVLLFDAMAVLPSI